MRFLSIFAVVIYFGACVNSPQKSANTASESAPATLVSQNKPLSLDPYWYQGKAELTAYDVQQERYGEMRKAEQVSIFVTEDFSKQKQVKLDNPASAGQDRVPVLKLNTVRHFQTGIYDYSLMESVFVPADGGQTLKTTCTVQDWCGHVFMQTNLTDGGYRVRQFSYFETEGDAETKVEGRHRLEDDLWVRLRFGPAYLPLGKLSIVPSAFYARMRHKPFVAHPAELRLEQGATESALVLQYSDIPRRLTIRFENTTPYRIVGWEELDGEKLMSKGTRKSVVVTDYWGKHGLEHDGWRDSLKLNF